jgi:YggT family protein
MGTLGEVGALIINTLGSLYLLAILLRFLLQIARADFYNPFVQAIVKVTDHPIKELRRVIPGMWGVDFATLIYAFIVHCVLITLLFICLARGIPQIGTLITWAAVGLLSYVVNIFYVSLLISIVSSFIAPHSAHPILVLTRQLTEPVMAPFRKLLPAMGGLDFSPIFLILAIMIIKTVIIEPAGMSAALVLGY